MSLREYPDEIKTRLVTRMVGSVSGGEPTEVQVTVGNPYTWRIAIGTGEVFYVSSVDDRLVVDPFKGKPPESLGADVGELVKLGMDGEIRYGGGPRSRRPVRAKELEAWQTAGILVPAKKLRMGGSA